MHSGTNVMFSSYVDGCTILSGAQSNMNGVVRLLIVIEEPEEDNASIATTLELSVLLPFDINDPFAHDITDMPDTPDIVFNTGTSIDIASNDTVFTSSEIGVATNEKYGV